MASYSELGQKAALIEEPRNRSLDHQLAKCGLMPGWRSSTDHRTKNGAELLERRKWHRVCYKSRNKIGPVWTNPIGISNFPPYPAWDLLDKQ
jgi:hypothetical protein